MKIKATFKTLPTSASHNCFACSPQNAAGLQMRFFAHDDAVYSRVTIPAHLGGWNRVAHGGVITTILDETMGWATMYLLKCISLTQTLTVDFKKPVLIGTMMEVESRVRERKGKREAIVEGILSDEEEKICALSTGIFTTFSPAVAKRIKIADDPMLAWYRRLFD
jgi:acyl-coenzyme A thioesterase PaaI-like protein